MNSFNNELFAAQQSFAKNRYHIRIQQRNGKKAITTLAGLEEDLDTKRICKYMRKAFNCNGNVKKGEFDEDIIQLQGDQRENIKQWLLDQEIVEKQDSLRIIVHGF